MWDWLKSLDPIDRDCVHRYEYLLGRKLADHAEYTEIDSQVDEMILEWPSRTEFFQAYPALARYKAHCSLPQTKSLESRIQAAACHTDSSPKSHRHSYTTPER